MDEGVKDLRGLEEGDEELAPSAGAPRTSPRLLSQVAGYEPLNRHDTDEAFARLDDARQKVVLALASVPSCLSVLKDRLAAVARGDLQSDCYALQVRAIAGMDLNQDRTGDSLQGRDKVLPADVQLLVDEINDVAPDPDWSRCDPREQISPDFSLDGTLSAVLRLRPGSLLMRDMQQAFAGAVAECGRLAGGAEAMSKALGQPIENGEHFLLEEGMDRPRLSALAEAGSKDAKRMLADIARVEIEQKASLPMLLSAVRSTRKASKEYTRALGAIVTRNLLLVGGVLKRNRIGVDHPSYEDLVQEGAQGLTVAAERYDRISGYQFSTFANWWVLAYVQRYRPESEWTIRVPWSAYKDGAAVAGAAERLEGRLGRPPSVAEISQEVGIAPDRVREHQRSFQKPISLDAPVGDEEDLCLADTLPSPQPEEEEDRDYSNVSALIRQAVRDLPAEERTVVSRRFGLDGSDPDALPSYGDLAKELGLCKETVRRRERFGMKRMLEGPFGPALRAAMGVRS